MKMSDDQAWLVRQAITRLGAEFHRKQAQLRREYEGERDRLQFMLDNRIVPQTTT